MDALRTGLKKFLRRVAAVQARIVLAIFYYLALTPYAVVARACGMRFLDGGPDGSATYWKTRPIRDAAESAQRSF